MIKLRAPLFLFALLASLFVPVQNVQAQNAKPVKLAIRAARMIDGKSDTPVMNPVILIEGEKITAVGASLLIPADAKVIDLGNLTLLPGLIDAHTHLLLDMNGSDDSMFNFVASESTAARALRGAKLGREELEAGITTVRDVGNSGVNGDIALRNAINNGWLPGPRIDASTRALAAPGGQFGSLIPEAQKIIEQEYVTLNGPDSARQAVRQALYDGAECIKVIVNGSPANVTLDEMKAIVEEAHTSGVKVAAHATDDKATRIAVEAGVDSVEHAYSISDETLKTMAEKHIFLVPTDGTLREYVNMTFGHRQPTAEERAELEKQFKPWIAGNGARLQRALKFGVPIAFGSDAYVTMPDETRGEVSLDTLEAYADEGMTPLQIIHAATSNAAELLGWQSKIGTLEAGKFADIIAVPGDPLKDATTLKHARFVMKGGEIIRNDASRP